MATQAYLILSPAQPADIASASIVQRQSIPLAWAIAVASKKATLTDENGQTYFDVSIADALAILDECIASWSWNSYFRDVLSPVAVFREWLSAHAPDAHIYVNVSELLRRSPNHETDIQALKMLSYSVGIALEETNKRNFSGFLQEMRKISFPFITVPITGNRSVDLKILEFEMRDTDSPEEEMALQMVGIDRDQSLLEKATAAINLHRHSASSAPRHVEEQFVDPVLLRLYTTDLDAAQQLLADELGCELHRKDRDHLLMNAHGREFEIRKISKRDEQEIYDFEDED